MVQKPKTWKDKLKKAQDKLLTSNNKIIKITEVAVLNKQDLGSKITLNLFFTVIEDITKIVEITKEDIN